MDSIRYLVISDTHFGCVDSVLNFYTFDEGSERKMSYHEPEKWPVLKKYIVEALAGSDIPCKLILLGDMFELSLADYSFAAVNTCAFLNEISKINGIIGVIYIPGNHDHHIWRQILEYDTVGKINDIVGEGMSGGLLPQNLSLDDFVINHVSPDPSRTIVGQKFLNFLLGISSEKLYCPADFIEIIYPNFMINTAQGPVFFHHGHFCEAWWQLASDYLTDIDTDVSLEMLEDMNSPFTDFIWYAVGQSPHLGKIVRTIYNELGDKDYTELKKVLDMIFEKIDYYDGGIRDNIVKDIKEYFRNGLIKRLLVRRIGKLLSENNSNTHAALRGAKMDNQLSEKLNKLVIRYIENYIHIWIKDYKFTTGCMPKFVFGHTHQISKTQVEVKAIQYEVYNTGGWIIEEGEIHPGVVYIDEKGVIELSNLG